MNGESRIYNWLRCIAAKFIFILFRNLNAIGIAFKLNPLQFELDDSQLQLRLLKKFKFRFINLEQRLKNVTMVSTHVSIRN